MDAGVPSLFDTLLVYETSTLHMFVIRGGVDVSLIMSVLKGERHSGILPPSLTTSRAAAHV